ncbi:MAG: Ig-like domain repeat protein [Acidimicrobiales bacterium]
MRGKSEGRGPNLLSSRSLAAVCAVLALLLALIAAEPLAGAAPGTTASCASLPYLNGFDVSSFSGTITWSDVTCEDFVYARATQGTSFDDPDFTAYRAGALGAHIPFGAYDFFEPDESGTTQASFFLDEYTPRPGDLPPVLDVEVTDGENASTIITGISDWVSTIESATGMVPMIYLAPDFWTSDVGDTSQFTADLLWDADVSGVEVPTVPASNWGGNGWTLWQYSLSGTVTGVSGSAGATDLDYYSGGSITGLESSAATTVTIPSVTSSAVVGQPITIHVQVSGSFTGTDVPAPSGTVTVSDGTRTCPAVLSGSGGVATGSCTISEEAAGPYSLTAHYPGDSDWDSSSTASSTPVSVGKATTTTAIKLSTDSVIYGDENAEHVTATVSPEFAGSDPTGTVTVTESKTTLCQITLASGTGSCSPKGTAIPSGSFRVVASYAGSSNFDASASPTDKLTIGKATTKTTLKLSASSTTYGKEQAEKLSVTVSPQFAGSVPSRTVTIKESSTTLCKITLKSGKGSCSLSSKALNAGRYSLIATYGASADFEGSESAKQTLTVKS